MEVLKIMKLTENLPNSGLDGGAAPGKELRRALGKWRRLGSRIITCSLNPLTRRTI